MALASYHITETVTHADGTVLVGELTYNKKRCWDSKLISPKNADFTCDTRLEMVSPVVFVDYEAEGISKPNGISPLIDIREHLRSSMLHFWENKESILAERQRIAELWKVFELEAAPSLARNLLELYKVFIQEDSAVKAMRRELRRMIKHEGLEVAKDKKREYELRLKHFRDNAKKDFEWPLYLQVEKRLKKYGLSDSGKGKEMVLEQLKSMVAQSPISQ